MGQCHSRREMPPIREMCDRADLDQQPCGAGRADAVQVHQRGAGGSDQSLELFVGLLGPLVDALEVSDQLSGYPSAGLASRVTRADRGQQRLGLGGGQALLRSARGQLQQQLVQLAALAGGEHPGPGGQFRRDVDYLLAIGEQPGGEVPADAPATLNCPDAVRPLLGVLEHGRVAGAVGVEAAAASTVSLRVITSMVAERLCGPMPMTTRSDRFTWPSIARSDGFVEPGGHRYFELREPLLSLSLLNSDARDCAGQIEPHRGGQPM